MKKRLLIFIIALVLASRIPAVAQSCTRAVCAAASPAEADVIAALPSSSNSNSAVTVTIPAGTATWTNSISYTVPTSVTSLTIQGSTTVNCTGAAGTASYACPSTDGTIIVAAYGSFGAMLQMYTNSSPSSVLRITGITWEQGNVSIGQDPIISFAGNGQIRWDHNHINNTTGTPQANTWVRNYGNTVGVVDHNLWDLSTCNGFGSNCAGFGTNAWGAFNDYNDSNCGAGGCLGDVTWANPTPWGSAKAIFFENNVFNGGASNDCYIGGFYVSRYNTMNDEYVPSQTHGTKTPGGPYRACRGFESYHNYITGPSGASEASGAIGSKGGPALIWGNTLASGTYYRFFEASTDRNGGDSADETTPPNGWGYCGSTTSIPSAGSPNGIGSSWDGNQPSLSEGYPCLDGLGRGQTVQALNNQPFPNRLNSVTGTISWPKQYLEPIYMWMNSAPGATYVQIQDLVTTNNRDYYYDQTAQSGNFTGAAGTGYGQLSARPATCTPGPGGTYGASPTGSYGVAYFAIDANSGNGELYVCTATNAWTGIYQPYTYPHPLVSGNSATSATPPAPTNLQSTVY